MANANTRFKIKNPQAALLSNHEVLLHLRAQEAEYSGTDGTGRKRTKPAGLQSALKDGIRYLEFHDTNHTIEPLATTHPDRPITLYKGPNSLFRALAPKYRLNKAEFLQLYNLKPTTHVELTLIIEESHTRFTEEQLEDILDTIRYVFEEPEADIPEGAEDEEMEKISNKLLGASRKRHKGVKRKT